MAQPLSGQSIARRSRRLAVESLQSRLVFAGALHALLDMGQQVYGQTVQAVGIGETGDIRILGDGYSGMGKVWDFDAVGHLVKQQAVGVLAGPGRIATPQAVSPNGTWLAGAQRDSAFHFDAFSRWGGTDLSTFVPVEGIEGVVDVANTGDLLVFGKVSKTWYRWSSSQGMTALASLEGASESYPTRISADGTIIIGLSYVGGKSVPTLWDALGPRALQSNEKNIVASSVSDDGRVIGGYTNNVVPTAVVWVNGTLKQVIDVNGAPTKGAVDEVVNGLWGDANRWVAFGNDDNNPWIAFEDGVARPLQQWVQDHYGIKLDDPPAEFLYTKQFKVVSAKVVGNDLKIILAELVATAQTASIPPHVFYGNTSPHLLSVPLENSATPLRVHPIDVNDDGVVSPIDAWIIINQLNAGKAGSLFERPELASAWPNIDTSGDGLLSPLDALNVINLLNRNSQQTLATQSFGNDSSTTGNAEGEADAMSQSPSLVDIDSVFGEIGARTRRLRR